VVSSGFFSRRLALAWPWRRMYPIGFSIHHASAPWAMALFGALPSLPSWVAFPLIRFVADGHPVGFFPKWPVPRRQPPGTVSERFILPPSITAQCAGWRRCWWRSLRFPSFLVRRKNWGLGICSPLWQRSFGLSGPTLGPLKARQVMLKRARPFGSTRPSAPETSGYLNVRVSCVVGFLEATFAFPGPCNALVFFPRKSGQSRKRLRGPGVKPLGFRESASGPHRETFVVRVPVWQLPRIRKLFWQQAPLSKVKIESFKKPVQTANTLPRPRSVPTMGGAAKLSSCGGICRSPEVFVLARGFSPRSSHGGNPAGPQDRLTPNRLGAPQIRSSPLWARPPVCSRYGFWGRARPLPRIQSTAPIGGFLGRGPFPANLESGKVGVKKLSRHRQFFFGGRLAETVFLRKKYAMFPVVVPPFPLLVFFLPIANWFVTCSARAETGWLLLGHGEPSPNHHRVSPRKSRWVRLLPLLAPRQPRSRPGVVTTGNSFALPPVHGWPATRPPLVSNSIKRHCPTPLGRNQIVCTCWLKHRALRRWRLAARFFFLFSPVPWLCGQSRPQTLSPEVGRPNESNSSRCRGLCNSETHLVGSHGRPRVFGRSRTLANGVALIGDGNRNDDPKGQLPRLRPSNRTAPPRSGSSSRLAKPNSPSMNRSHFRGSNAGWSVLGPWGGQSPARARAPHPCGRSWAPCSPPEPLQHNTTRPTVFGFRPTTTGNVAGPRPPPRGASRGWRGVPMVFFFFQRSPT